MNGRPLDFDPGTKEVYSNYGFIVLGQVIAHVTGKPFEESVEKLLFEPIGVSDVQFASPRTFDLRHPAPYLPYEAKRYFIGNSKALPAGHAEATGAAGGWDGSAVAMARFLTALDGSRTGKPYLNDQLMEQMLAKPLPPLKARSNHSWYGLGWDEVREIHDWPHGKGLAYGKDGGVNGISTYIEHLPGDIDWVVLFNGALPEGAENKDEKKNEKKGPDSSDKPAGKSNEKPADEPTSNPDDTADASVQKPSDAPKISALHDTRPRMVELLRGVTQWPKGDLFSKYR
jgi:CubicO group peptidase (beta-lactamase class C family)